MFGTPSRTPKYMNHWNVLPPEWGLQMHRVTALATAESFCKDLMLKITYQLLPAGMHTYLIHTKEDIGTCSSYFSPPEVALLFECIVSIVSSNPNSYKFAVKSC